MFTFENLIDRCIEIFLKYPDLFSVVKNFYIPENIKEEKDRSFYILYFLRNNIGLNFMCSTVYKEYDCNMRYCSMAQYNSLKVELFKVSVRRVLFNYSVGMLNTDPKNWAEMLESENLI